MYKSLSLYYWYYISNKVQWRNQKVKAIVKKIAGCLFAQDNYFKVVLPSLMRDYSQHLLLFC